MTSILDIFIGKYSHLLYYAVNILIILLFSGWVYLKTIFVDICKSAKFKKRFLIIIFL